MVDIEDAHRVGGLVDFVVHAVFPPARTPVTVEWCSQWRTDSSRRPDQRSGDELPGRDGGGLGEQIGERAPRTRSHYEPVGLFSHAERRDLGFA